MPEHNQNHFANNLSQFSDNDNTAENVNQQIEKKGRLSPSKRNRLQGSHSC